MHVQCPPPAATRPLRKTGTLHKKHLAASCGGFALCAPLKRRHCCEISPMKHTDPLRDAPSPTAIAAFESGMAKFWQPVARSSDLGGGYILPVRLLGTPVALARLDGKLTAVLDVCRHYQARLSLGEIAVIDGKQAIQCPYHGWAYGLHGACVRIPQFPAGRKIPAGAGVPSFAATEALGLIWVCLEGPAAFGLPAFPEYDDPAFRAVILDEDIPTKTASTRMIMGTLDDTHFPWVHEGILGDRDKPAAPDHVVTRDGPVLKVDYDMMQPASLSSGATDGADVAIEYRNEVHMPNVVKLAKNTPSGRYIVWLATCPVDHKTCRNFWTFARDYDLDPARDEIYREFSTHVRQQDKPIIESQRPWLLPPFWTQIEMPLRPGDLPLIAYQKWLEELGIGHEI
jgi:phenylpropionate dioxygenase-like ring-hydroxylating dioxygenase large terminal subunit